MKKPVEIFEKCLKLNDLDFIYFLWELKIIKREMNCSACGISMRFVSFERTQEKYAWRCMNSLCIKKKNTSHFGKEASLRNLEQKWFVVWVSKQYTGFS